MMVNNNVDFETAADILLEVKEKAGIPADRMISRIPMCIIRGKEYKSIAELASELKLQQGPLVPTKQEMDVPEFWKH